MIACKQTTRRSDSRLAVLGGALLLTLGAGCKAPKILCTTAHAGAGNVPFAVRYTLVSGTGDCAGLKGGLVGIESYVNGGPEQAPSFPKPPVAIRVAEVGDLIGAYTEEPPPPPDGGAPVTPVPFTPPSTKMLSSVGAFVDERPDENGFCKVGTMTPVSLDLPAMGPEKPAMKVSYEWSNVSFYVSPRLIGTQFSSDLKYTLNGCVATYKVVGLYPGVHCEKVAMCEGQDDPVPTGEVDPAACSPCADPAGGRPAGSGISPDIETVCEPGVFLCLPKAAPPSLNATPTSCGATSTPAAGDAAAVAPPTSSFMCPDAAPPADDASGGGAADTAAPSGDTAAPGGDTAAPAADVASGG